LLVVTSDSFHPRLCLYCDLNKVFTLKSVLLAVSKPKLFLFFTL